MRRRSLVGLFFVTGCGEIVGGLSSGIVGDYRTMQSGAAAHGYQTASFIYGFADGTSRVWLKTLDAMQADALPLLRALKKAGIEMRLELENFDADGRASATAYELAMHLGDHSLPGKPGTDPAIYEAALGPAAEATGIAPEPLKKGHFALYALANGMTPLNAAHDSLKDHAFKLLLLRAKIAAGEKQVDWFDPNRPADESLADIGLALQMIEDEHRRLAERRAAILAMVALARGYRQPKAIAELASQIEESRVDTNAWRASHQRPTAEDHGVKPAILPSPADIKKRLDEKLGFLGALFDVAQAVVTANPHKALDALVVLAPEDSSVETALAGLAAATRGDIAGTIDAVAKLADETEAADAIKARLEQVNDVANTAKKL